MATRLDDGSWEVQGRRLRFPVRITDAAAAAAVHLVPAAPVRRLLAGTGLDAVAVAGRVPLLLALVDYRAGDLGAYREVFAAVPARHGARLGVHVLQMPVTQGFTLEAGRVLWGLPKWLAGIDLAIDGRTATGRLDDGGRGVLGLALRAPVRLPVAVPARITALAPRGAAVLTTPIRARLHGVRLGRHADLTLADHPVADELRALGLPRAPLLTVVADRVTMALDAAVER